MPAGGTPVGKTMENLGPSWVFSAQIRPPWRLTIVLQIARPSPQPGYHPMESEVTYSSKIRSRTPDGIAPREFRMSTRYQFDALVAEARRSVTGRILMLALRR